MNSTAQQHALEQANLITQLIKYADRVIVVESASDAERRAFVKLIDDQLPESVGVLALRASPNTEQAEIIREISSLLQLSPGIEAPRQLASAIQTALGNQGRLLTIIENADAWHQTTQWSGLMAHIQAANKMAPNHWLFLLTGAPGLTEKLRSDPQLADLTAEIHRCELLGEADATAPTGAAPMPPPTAPVASELHAEDRFAAAPPAPKKSHGTALLVAAALSVAVVTFGGFALLTRSHDSAPATPTTQTLALNAPAAPVAPPPTAPAQTDNPLPNDGANGTPQVDGSVADAPAGAASSPAPLIPPKPASNATPAAPAQPASLPSPPPVAAPIPPVEPPAPAPRPVAQELAPKPVTEPRALENKASENKVPERTVHETKTHETKVHEQKAVEKREPEKHETAKRAPEKAEHAKSAAPVRVAGVDNAWYRQQKTERAVLQLGAFNDEKAALAFIRTHERGTALRDWHLFTQVRDGKTLYTVTVGDFATLAAARDGIGQLPTALRAIKPYPRSFKAIQDIIK